LYPVHYAVATNEDVFELIKFDILSELLIRYPELIEEEKEKFSTALEAQVFLLQHKGADNFIGSIVSVASKTGKSLIDILTAIKKLRLDFKQFETEIDRPEYKSLEDYLNRFSEQPGGVHEMDDVSRHIFKLPARLKESDSEQQQRKTVLIIDDLDRLDPEHIFRLFNIFSAHYDGVTEQNKFGFDNVIFVCDVQNIKRMYFHRYGKGVDFSGYMDKFYSSSPFQFDSKTYIINKIDEFITLKLVVVPKFLEAKAGKGSYFKAYQRLILTSLVYADLLSLRTLDQCELYYLPPSFRIRVLKNGYMSNIPPYQVRFLWLIEYLRAVIPDVDQLRSNFQRLADAFEDSVISGLTEDFSRSNDVFFALMADCLMFLLPPSEVFNDDYISDEEKNVIKYYHWHYNEADFFIAYSLSETREDHVRMRHPRIHTVQTKPENDAPIIEANTFALMAEALDKCLQSGIIKY